MAGIALVSPAVWALPGSYGVLSLSSASWQTLAFEIWLSMAGTVTTSGCQGRRYNTQSDTSSFPFSHIPLLPIHY